MAVAAAMWHSWRRKKNEDDQLDEGEAPMSPASPPCVEGMTSPSHGTGGGAGVRVATEYGTIRMVENDELQENLDANNDGVVSPEEMKNAFSMVSIRADILLVRMSTEKELAVMIRKLPVFFTCVVCFLIGLIELTPPSATSDIHRHLNSHFGLKSLEEVTSFDEIYEYMEMFAEQNSKLEATSYKYWCEERYSNYIWDHILSVPHWTCESPRQFALGLTPDTTWSYTHLNSMESQYYRRSMDEAARPDANDAGGAADSSPSEHRRVGAVGPSSEGNYTCEDDDAGLQAELRNESATCALMRDTCDLELGILMCPKTCGFCGPFEYRHTSRFPKAQVTMLPALVYQTRFAAADCHGFASAYESQPTNPALWQSPALDGRRKGKLLHCLDRGKKLEDEYAMERRCPETAPQTGAHACPVGDSFKVTPKADFHGMAVYPKLLSDPSRHLHQLKALQWLDVQTETVSISTMVYTEEIEIFTSLTVDFTMSRSGRVQPSFRMVSYRDMIGASKATFVAGMIATSLLAALGVLLSFHNFYVDRAQCKMGLVMYELISRTMLLVYPVALLISWSQQELMSKEYDELLHAFLDITDTSEDSWREMISHFFEVKTHIYEETSWLKSQRVAAYLVLYFQFLQLLFYLSAHPKMGVLTATISRATAQLIHFALLFTIMYILLGFMAHWMLGEHIEAFSSMAHTMQAQSQMMLGEDFIPDGVSDLTVGFSVMYWVYASTFLIVVFFTLLNFFLAIIVDAFCDVKDNAGKHAILGDFFSDIWRVVYINIKWRARRWPSRASFIEYWTSRVAEAMQKSWLEELDSEDNEEKNNQDNIKVVCSPAQVVEAIDGLSEDELAHIIAFYYSLSNKVLCRKSGTRSNLGTPTSRHSPAKPHAAQPEPKKAWSSSPNEHAFERSSPSKEARHIECDLDEKPLSTSPECESDGEQQHGCNKACPSSSSRNNSPSVSAAAAEIRVAKKGSNKLSLVPTGSFSSAQTRDGVHENASDPKSTATLSTEQESATPVDCSLPEESRKSEVFGWLDRDRPAS